MESASLDELKLLTSDVRRAVVQREITLSNASANANEIKRKRVSFVKNSKRELIEYQKKYDELQELRRDEFRFISFVYFCNYQQYN